MEKTQRDIKFSEFCKTKDALSHHYIFGKDLFGAEVVVNALLEPHVAQIVRPISFVMRFEFYARSKIFNDLISLNKGKNR